MSRKIDVAYYAAHANAQSYRIPLRPSREDGEPEYISAEHCPRCRHKFEEHTPYCPECGQAIQWGRIYED